METAGSCLVEEKDMRLGLIGSGMHWQTYAPALKHFTDLELVAVAAAGPEETTGAFDHAPGLTVETRRYDEAQRMLDTQPLDLVQVCCRPDRNPYWSARCLERDLPVLSDKPLAMDMPTLESLFRTAHRSKAPLLPMHTQRGEAAFAAVAQAVQAGEIGKPLAGFSQKSYKWGKSRPDYFRSRRSFPGLAPFVGIHAFDWLHWILGDVFLEVQGSENIAAHPDYPACASHAAFTLTAKDGGVIALTLDYLRPATAPTHGDEHIRLAGTGGVIETALIEQKVTLVTSDKPPRVLPLPEQPDIATAFVRSLRGDGPLPISLHDSFRITEIALKAQQAADTGKPVTLARSAFSKA
jgi:predicted dehydrogenase